MKAAAAVIRKDDNIVSFTAGTRKLITVSRTHCKIISYIRKACHEVLVVLNAQ